MYIRKARKEEIKLLTNISKRSFDTDITVGAPSIKDKPPGYDCYKYHDNYYQKGELYSFIKEDNKLIGGAILIRYEDKDMCIARLFIDPKYFRKGYGKRAMRLIEKTSPKMDRIILNTPPWNVRTNSFYKKCGYTFLCDEEDGFHVYAKYI